ncbi:MAG: cobalamin-dependent protein [Candidatus Omnitrophica bacterium]|nr:cobalamin-dependent protein [Candidatus Omnitrophota bacterium]
MFVMYISYGLFSLSSFLNKNGISSRILHLGVEYIKEGKIDLNKYIPKNKHIIVGLSLHWNHQSYDVIEVARKIKSINKNVYIVLGGMTASIFDVEILEEFPFVDGIIRGDGEVPLLKLFDFKNQSDKNLVPNLTWRKDNEIIRNSLDYVSTSDDLNKYDFAAIDNLIDYDVYRDRILHIFHCKDIPFFMAKNLIGKDYMFFPLLVVKGCTAECSYCGGSYSSQLKISGRKHIIYQSPEKVLEAIKKLKTFGFNGVYIIFDPVYGQHDYFYELFAFISKNKLKIACGFTLHSLPENEFLKLFKDTFCSEKGSFLEITIESHDEIVRKKNKSFFYSNDEFFDFLSRCDSYNIPLKVFLSIGMPFQNHNEEYSKANNAFERKIKSFKNAIKVSYSVVDIDPYSPAYLNPEKFNLELKKNKFTDYYAHHKISHKRNFPAAGFSDITQIVLGDGFCFNEEKLIDIKCEYSCQLNILLRRMHIRLPSFIYKKICKIISFFWRFSKKIEVKI